MKLTDKAVRGLKPTDKRRDILDGDGLNIRIEPSGRKVWWSRVKKAGRIRTKFHGEYPALSLADARTRHREFAEQVKTGNFSGMTVKRLVAEYLEKHAVPNKRSHAEDKRVLEKDVVSAIGSKLIEDVRGRDIILLCEGIVGRGADRQAHITYAKCRKMFRFAVQKGLIEASPCADLAPPGSPGSRKDRVLSSAEIKSAWEAFGERMDPATARALRLVLVTGQRPGECFGAAWEEVNDKWWTIPAERAKNKKPHRVYLTDLAKEVMGKKGAGLVFPSPLPDRAGNRGAMDKNTPARATRRLFKPIVKGWPALAMPAFTPHDLRRTAATICGDAGWDNDKIGPLLLNHQKGEVTEIYNRAKYDRDRQNLAETIKRGVLAALAGSTLAKVIPIAG